MEKRSLRLGWTSQQPAVLLFLYKRDVLYLKIIKNKSPRYIYSIYTGKESVLDGRHIDVPNHSVFFLFWEHPLPISLVLDWAVRSAPLSIFYPLVLLPSQLLLFFAGEIEIYWPDRIY